MAPKTHKSLHKSGVSHAPKGPAESPDSETSYTGHSRFLDFSVAPAAPWTARQTHTLGSCTRTQRASHISQRTACTRPAHARRAAAAAANAQGRLTATSTEACRRCSSPAVGMSMPEARTRLTPLTVDVLLLIQLDATRTTNLVLPQSCLPGEQARRIVEDGKAANGSAADERKQCWLPAQQQQPVDHVQSVPTSHGR